MRSRYEAHEAFLRHDESTCFPVFASYSMIKASTSLCVAIALAATVTAHLTFFDFDSPAMISVCRGLYDLMMIAL